MKGGFETERLVIETVKPEHAAQLFDALQDERIYQYISSVRPTSVAGLAERWARYAALPGSLNWAVRRRDGAWVGKLDAEVEGLVAVNVGYLFFPPFWGQGYASEALAGMLRHLEAHGVVEEWATVTNGNVASTRVLERAGFERTRILPENDEIRGRKVDDLEYVRRPQRR